MLDWGEGDYGRTARMLAPVAEEVVRVAAVGPASRVLDVGCGTGNALIAAGARGAEVVGIDPSAGLVEIAARRAREAGLEAEVAVASAEAIPRQAGEFDAVVSVFAVIFAEDPQAAAGEMVRVLAREGTLVIASWIMEGAFSRAGEILRDALPVDSGPERRWHDREWIEELLTAGGARSVAFERGDLAVESSSPEDLFSDWEDHHPAWRAARQAIGEDGWGEVRRSSVAALSEGNQAPAALRLTTSYLLTTATR